MTGWIEIEILQVFRDNDVCKEVPIATGWQEVSKGNVIALLDKQGKPLNISSSYSSRVKSGILETVKPF